MGAATNWKLTIYGSNTNTATGTTPDAYKMRTCAITALTAATSVAAFIIKPEAKPEVTAEKITDIGGDEIGFLTRRGTFNVQSYPYTYDATSAVDLQDLDDLVALANVATDYDHLYIRIDAGSRTYPSTTGTVYPVTVSSWDEALNTQQGTRQLSVVFAHKQRS